MIGNSEEKSGGGYLPVFERTFFLGRPALEKDGLFLAAFFQALENLFIEGTLYERDRYILPISIKTSAFVCGLPSFSNRCRSNII